MMPLLTLGLAADLAPQKDFAFTRCHVCGMMYAKGTASDDRLHRQQHQAFLRGTAFQVRLTSGSNCRWHTL